MCDTNAIGDFDLNLVKIRKPLEFPDATIQSTAYTGGAGVPTLEEVLLSDNDANGEDIIGVGSIQFDDLTTQTTAYLGVPNLAAVLAVGNSAGSLAITNAGQISCSQVQFPDLSIQQTSAPITRWLSYSSNGTNIPVTNSAGGLDPAIIYASPTLALAGQYQLSAYIKIQTTGTVENLLLTQSPLATTGTLSSNVISTNQYINTAATYTPLGAGVYLANWIMPITTTVANTAVNVLLTGYWENTGTLQVINGYYQLTYLGFSTGA